MGESPIGSGSRVALFVDGDNLAPSLSDALLQTAGRHGALTVRRVYAAETGFRAWKDAAGYRPIQVGGAKNGTDLLLCIDAVETACKGGFETFALASDDRDFTHLAHWLRERGLHVLGLGTGKSCAAWRAACSEFVLLNSPGPMPAAKKPSAGASLTAALSATDAKIRDMIRSDGEDGSIGIGCLGVRMAVVHNVTLQRLQASNWRGYLRSKPNLYHLDPKAVTARVRWIGP